MTRTQAAAKARRAARVLLNAQTKRMKWRGLRPVSEAASKVGLSIPRLYQLLDAGELRGTRQGARRYVKWSSLRTMFPEAFARTRRNGPQRHRS